MPSSFNPAQDRVFEAFEKDPLSVQCDDLAKAGQPMAEISPHGESCRIWMSGGNLYLSIPGVTGRWHTTVLPAGEVGFATIKQILGERERATYRKTLGTKASPTQSQVDVLRMALESGKFNDKINRPKPKDISLEDLGL